MDRKPETQKPGKAPLLIIGVNKDNQVYVTGPLQDKQLCISLIAEALKIIANPPKDMENLSTEQPQGFLNGIKNLRRH